MSIQRSGISVTALLGLALAAIFSFSAYAADGVNVSSGLTLAGGPLALRGHDAVAYIADGQATRGTADHATLHEGAVYRFASAKNKATFEADPARYLPAFGGFCAYGAAVGAKFDGDPEVFAVVNGRLYLNLNSDIQQKWEEDVQGNIAKANKNWRSLQNTAIADLK